MAVPVPTVNSIWVDRSARSHHGFEKSNFIVAAVQLVGSIQRRNEASGFTITTKPQFLRTTKRVPSRAKLAYCFKHVTNTGCLEFR